MKQIWIPIAACLCLSSTLVWAAADPAPVPVPVPVANPDPAPVPVPDPAPAPVPVPVADPNPKADPDVNQNLGYQGDLPNNNFEGRSSRAQDPNYDDPACSKLEGARDKCIEKIKGFEFRPFIKIDKQNYKVYDPKITYTDIKTVSEYTKDVRMPKPFTTSVPVYHVKEHPKTKTLTKIKEVVIKVPVVNTQVTENEKKIPIPTVTNEELEVAEIIPRERPLVVSNPVKKPRQKIVEKFIEVPRVIKHRRPVVRIVPKQVNVTTIKYIEKTVEVPKIIRKTIRLPRPVKRDGGIIYADQTKVSTVRTEHDDEFPEYYDEPVESTKVEKVPKKIMVPFMETERVVRPILVEAPIVIPDKRDIDVEEHERVPGPAIAVPCGVTTPDNTYLPSPCPSCPDRGSCPTCKKCEMETNIDSTGGYTYIPPTPAPQRRQPNQNQRGNINQNRPPGYNYYK